MSKLLSDLKEIDSRIQKLENARKIMRQLYAEESCPFKIGDIVTCYGYSYTGKKMIVERIYFSDWIQSHGWAVEGLILLDNGKPGSRRTNFRVDQYENKKNK